MADRTAWRLLGAAKPYWGLFLLGLGATLLASLLDGVAVVILVPLLKALFGTAGALATQGNHARTGHRPVPGSARGRACAHGRPRRGSWWCFFRR
jgi:hypothetical protein